MRRGNAEHPDVESISHLARGEGDDMVGRLINVTTVGDCFERAAVRWPDREVVLPAERATYEAINSRITEFSRSLLGSGIVSGDKVGLLMSPQIDYLAAMVAIMRVGATAVPINARYKSHELRHVITSSDMRLLLTDATGGHVDFLGLISGALPELASTATPELDLEAAPELRQIVVVGTPSAAAFLPIEEFWKAGESVPDDDVWLVSRRVQVREVACIVYTSGTTASPKGAMLSHEALVRQSSTTALTRLRIDADDVVWAPLPMFHIGGVSFALACASVGATYVHAGDFVADVAVRQLMNEDVTVALPAFETIWLAVLHHPEFDATQLDRLRLVFNVGIPERLRGMQELLPNAVQVSGFGGTEACSFLTIGVPEDSIDDRVNTTGYVLEGMELRIIDVETGEEALTGQLGEIQYRGYARFDGYYGDPERTAEAIDVDGWFHSGDMGTVDESGRLVYVTRLKDMLKVGGENVAAAEIEGFLLTHPAVLMAQVVAAPDARYTEVPCAFVVLRPDTSASEAELIEHCLGDIATFKVPRYVRFVGEYPMSGTKVKKHVLRELIAAELEQAGITEAPKLMSTPR